MTQRSNDAIEIIGKERAKEIKEGLFGDKKEFSRTDFMMFGKAIRKEAIVTLKNAGLKNEEIAKQLSITEGTVRYYLS